MNVLFVCSGNICRSPMAEICLRQSVSLAGLPQIKIASAGTLGIEGAPASREAVFALDEIGLDLSHHRSQGVTETLVMNSDVVLVMERGHLDELSARFPGGERRRFLIRAFEKGSTAHPNAPDLPDPIGLPIGVYRGLLNVLDPCIDHLTTYLRGLEPGRDS